MSSSHHYQHRRGRSTSPVKRPPPPPSHLGAEDDSLINTRQLEAFGRTVQATASHLMGPPGETAEAYRHALTSVQRSLRRPMIQRSVFSLAKANPRELIRANFNTAEIENRAISYVPDELLRHVPASRSPFSLLDGFKASLPADGEGAEESLAEKVGRRRRRKALEERERGAPGLRKEKDRLNHRLEMMGIRKTMCASEIKEIDDKIANLNAMRRHVLDRLAGLEQEELDMEQEISEVAERIDVLQEEEDDRTAAEQATAAAARAATKELNRSAEDAPEEEEDEAATGFMSESIYEKLPKANASNSARASKRRKGVPRRISMPVLHEHMEPGSRIRELQAHTDTITAIDFDAPFGTMVTAALDDTVRVWDLNAGRCMGMLDGHLSSVRCLQMEDNIVATGSMDASIRLWDLSQADYNPAESNGRINGRIPEDPSEEDSAATGEDLFSSPDGNDISSEVPSSPPPPPSAHGSSMADCALFTLESHVAEITALTFRGSTLVSGSADKTLRQWDLEKGRCVQTLDVLWAAAQAASTLNTSATTSASSPPGAASAAGAGGSGSSSGGGGAAGGWWRPTASRVPDAEADFIGSLQVFDAALACGTADGMVRLWDLRSGMVHRSLVGHTGPVTALQFDDVYLVTGSRDRSIRIWDLRTGTIHDAYAYDSPITSMQFDARRIVAAAGEDVVKVYDKADGRHWDCGAGTFSASGTDAHDHEGHGHSSSLRSSVVERVRIKDGYLVEGRRDGVVGVWSC